MSESKKLAPYKKNPKTKAEIKTELVRLHKRRAELRKKLRAIRKQEWLDFCVKWIAAHSTSASPPAQTVNGFKTHQTYHVTRKTTDELGNTRWVDDAFYIH